MSAQSTAAGPRVAASIALVFALVTWLGVWLSTGESAVVSNMQSPFALGVTGVTLPIALGLWLRKQWAYWLGLLVGGWQLISHALFLVVSVATERRLGLLDWLFELVLAAFVLALLFPATRRGCTQPPKTSK